ncbi:MAG: carbohydrate ABC transporter permease [Candidatus Enteromonas sp.]
MLNCDKKNHGFNATVYVLLCLFGLIILVPMFFILANSVSDYADVAAGKVGLIPTSFNFEIYAMVLGNPLVQKGFLNSLLYTVLGTAISLFLTFTAAYPLSRKDFKHRGFFSAIFLLTMFVSGGMIPTFLVVDGLGLRDTIWGFILPGALSVWNLMVARSFLAQTIPFELYEAAKIDGMGDFRIFLHVVLPMSIPILAIMTLFYGVGYWNSYFNSLLYLSDPNLFPLQRVLSDIVISNDISSFGIGGSMIDQGKILRSIQYVSIVVSSAPILLVAPFFGKYIEKGALLGSIKG